MSLLWPRSSLGPRQRGCDRGRSPGGRCHHSAALTPLLLWLVRQAYIAAGGTEALGLIGGTGVRLVLAALVLAVPTFLMGGTLPAAARAATPSSTPPR